MAKFKKESEEEKKASAFDFILPLEDYQLREMWDKYTDGKQIKNFRGKCGRLALAEYVYYSSVKAYSYDEKYGEWSVYHPEGESADDLTLKLEKARRHWRQFEDYARRRQFAIANSVQQDYQGVSEVKLNNFWEPDK